MGDMTIKNNPVLLAAAKFCAADDAWSLELTNVFGRQACQARYGVRGKGLPGSTLRERHDAREAARQEWEARRA
jgi:hypothetical protein